MTDKTTKTTETTKSFRVKTFAHISYDLSKAQLKFFEK
jgi:hypothetical protein